jgi:hypothetical protein
MRFGSMSNGWASRSCSANGTFALSRPARPQAVPLQDSTRSRKEFATAVRTHVAEFCGARRAERALEAADPRVALTVEACMTPLTLGSHFQHRPDAVGRGADSANRAGCRRFGAAQRGVLSLRSRSPATAGLVQSTGGRSAVHGCACSSWAATCNRGDFVRRPAEDTVRCTGSSRPRRRAYCRFREARRCARACGRPGGCVGRSLVLALSDSDRPHNCATGRSNGELWKRADRTGGR